MLYSNYVKTTSMLEVFGGAVENVSVVPAIV
jgi:hypothetical protein